MGEVHLGEARIEGRAGVSVIWDSKEGHTGREVRGDGGYALAIEWARQDTEVALLGHPAHDEFVGLLASAPRLHDRSLIYFRGRRNEGRSRTSTEMGPPPNGPRTREGR